VLDHVRLFPENLEKRKAIPEKGDALHYLNFSNTVWNMWVFWLELFILIMMGFIRGGGDEERDLLSV